MNFKGILAIIGIVTAGAIAASPPGSHRGARQTVQDVQSNYDACMVLVVPDYPTGNTASQACGGPWPGSGCATFPGCILRPPTYYGAPAGPSAQQINYDDCMINCTKREANKPQSGYLPSCQTNCAWSSGCVSNGGQLIANCVIRPYNSYYSETDIDYFNYLNQCYMGSLAWPIDLCRNITYGEWCTNAWPPCVIAAKPVPLNNLYIVPQARASNCIGLCSRFTSTSSKYTACTQKCNTYICCSSKCGSTTPACSGHYFSVDYPWVVAGYTGVPDYTG